MILNENRYRKNSFLRPIILPQQNLQSQAVAAQQAFAAPGGGPGRGPGGIKGMIDWSRGWDDIGFGTPGFSFDPFEPSMSPILPPIIAGGGSAQLKPDLHIGSQLVPADQYVSPYATTNPVGGAGARFAQTIREGARGDRVLQASKVIKKKYTPVKKSGSGGSYRR